MTAWDVVRLRILFPLALLTMLGLAGCSSKDPGQKDPGESESTNSSGQPSSSTSTTTSQNPCLTPCGNETRLPGHFALNDCWDLTANFNALRSSVQALLPSGYTATDSAVGTTIVTTEILDCQSAVLDNRTVLGPTRVAMVMVPVSAPAAVASEANGDLFVFDVFTDNSTLAARLQEEGFASQLATMDASLDSSPFSADVAVEGGPRFELSLAGSAPQTQTAFTQVLRYHHVGTAPTWLDYQMNSAIASTPLVGTLTHTGGVLAELAPSSPIPVGATLWRGASILDFKPNDTM